MSEPETLSQPTNRVQELYREQPRLIPFRRSRLLLLPLALAARRELIDLALAVHLEFALEYGFISISASAFFFFTSSTIFESVAQ